MKRKRCADAPIRAGGNRAMTGRACRLQARIV
jgi:hypothetical protein